MISRPCLLALAAAGAFASNARTAALAAPEALAVEPAAAEALAVVHAFGAALSAGESELAGRYLDPGIVVVIDNRVVGAREDYLAAHADADAARRRVDGRPGRFLQARASEELAWVVSERAVQADDAGGAVEIETMVLGRTAEGWKILHIHWSTRAMSPRRLPPR